jgi:hypothetical protein
MGPTGAKSKAGIGHASSYLTMVEPKQPNPDSKPA